MENSANGSTTTHQQSPGGTIFIIVFVIVLTLGCGTFTIQEESADATGPGEIPSEKIYNGSIGAKGGSITSPQGASVTFPPGAVSKSSSYTFNTLTDEPDWMADAGISAVGDGIEMKFAGDVQLENVVEIRLPIQISGNADPSYYTIYSFDGQSWTDVGGIVEGKIIKTWTVHFSSFWPAQDVAPHRPIAFVNQGWYNARIFVNTYTPDPFYAPAAFPMGSTISLAPTSPGAPNLSRYIVLPVGGYTFCIDWTDGKDEDKNGVLDYYHVYTGPTGVFDYDPKPVDAAKWITISPGRDAKNYPGPCSPTVPARTAWQIRTLTPTSRGIGAHTVTVTPSRVTQTAKVATVTRTPIRSITPTRFSPTLTKSPTKPYVNIQPYRDAYLKKIDELRAEFQKRNCTPIYSGCFEDIFGMPTALRSYLYTEYWANVHRSFIPFAQSLETQLLAELRTCFEQFIANRNTNLDVRKGEQSACIAKINTLGQTELRRIQDTSCKAGCGELGKAGSAEGVPLSCVCK